MEEQKSVISTTGEQDQHVVAAAQHILKALAASKTVSDDLRKTLLDLETQLSSISIVNERKGRGIKQLEKQLKCVEDKVTRWEQAKPDSEYLKVVDEIHSLIQSLEGLSANENWKKPKELLRRANEVLQAAMSSLEEELVHVLHQHKQYFEPEYMSFHSNRVDMVVHDESFRSVVTDDDDEQIDEALRSSGASRQSEASTAVDLVNPAVLQHLKGIASVMFGSKYHQEFCQVFVTSRRDALAEYFVILEMDKLSIENVLKLEWHCLNREIKKWIRAMKIIVRVYLVSEKRLCKDIVGDFGSFYQCCFSEISQSFMLHLLNFGMAVAIGAHTPEKMFRLLDMYEVLEHLAVDVEILFFEEVGSFVRTEYHKLLRNFGDTVKSTFLAFRSVIATNHSKTPFPQGGVHHVTKYVMNYIMTLVEYSDTLNNLLLVDDETSVEIINDNKHDTTPMARHFRSITTTLESNLSNKSRLYRDEALQHIFMMNNVHYMVQKVKCSDLSHFFGDCWLRQHAAMYQRHARCYERLSWCSVLSMLKDDGSGGGLSSKCVSVRTLEKRCKDFSNSFGEVYRMQTGWCIPDSQLREDLQISVSQKVVLAYRTYTGRNSSNIAEKYIKYTVDDLESYILDLFQGSPKSLHYPHQHRK